jgi:hypothetical protein
MGQADRWSVCRIEAINGAYEIQHFLLVYSQFFAPLARLFIDSSDTLTYISCTNHSSPPDDEWKTLLSNQDEFIYWFSSDHNSWSGKNIVDNTDGNFVKKETDFSAGKALMLGKPQIWFRLSFESDAADHVQGGVYVDDIRVEIKTAQ